MALSAGDRLGRYEIVAPLGAGGMGEVYRARDTQLAREVAVKVLPEAVATDPARLERFRREARAVAALSHPNILEIHDVGSTNGVHYAVTELLEGQTLRERVPTSGLPWQKVLELGVGIADGLAAAHARGIVHRDLKPENVFVTSDGRVKVLDFGLARVEQQVATEAETGTLTPAGTQAGTIMGTVGYMAPEQVRGHPADHRSDIFAFGCVMYEMVSGRRAFGGDTTPDAMAAILKEEPAQLSSTGALLPADLERTIHRCLEKSPEARFQSAADLAYSLRSIGTGPAAMMATPTGELRPVRGTRRGWVIVAAAVVVLAAIGVVAGWLVRSLSKPELTPPTSSRLTAYPGDESDPALSPDGSMVAFSRQSQDGGCDLFVKLVGGGEPLLLTRGSRLYYTPTWSPDGLEIAFVRCNRGDDRTPQCTVNVVPALGGPERQLTELRAQYPGGLSWSPDGRRLAIVDTESADQPTGIFLMSLETGDTRRLTLPGAPDARADEQPRFSPDGTTVVFQRYFSKLESDIFLVAADGGEPRRLTHEKAMTSGLDWTADGRGIVFSSSRPGRPGWLNLWRVSVSGGEPEPLPFGDNGADPSVSRKGARLVFTRGEGKSSLWRVGGPAARQEDRTPTRFISSTGWENYPQYSPDGQSIVFGSFRSGYEELWICDSDGSNTKQLTFLEEAGAHAGVWSPDGRQIAFTSKGEAGFDVWVVSAAGGIPRRITSHPSSESPSGWSRDGGWIYYFSDWTGRPEVFRVPPAGGDPVQVTFNGGTIATESPDGRHLYYTKSFMREGPRGIWRMPIEGGDEEQVHDHGLFGL